MSHPISLRVALPALLLAMAVLTLFAPTFRIAQAAPVASARIMPLGDSLTDGYNIPGGYRTYLWSKFTADNLAIDFVGSLVNGPTSLGDRNHE